MKHFWALPAALRVTVVLAAQRPFSVSDDLLAYPQFKVQWDDDYVTEAFAETKVSHTRDRLQPQPNSHIERYEPSPTPQPGRHDGDNDGRGTDEDYEIMLFEKQRFLCSIPRIDPSDQDSGQITLNETTLAQQKEEEAKELARVNARGWELLSGMQGECVYYISGWWTYSFCFQKGVRQFHALAPSRGIPVFPPQEDPSVEGYMLGSYEPASQAAKASSGTGVAVKKNAATTNDAAQFGELVAKGDSRYLVQKLDGGTVCDLTGKGRRVEIQFHCNPSMPGDRISLIKEVSTCAYLLVIQTSRLCNDVAFLPPQKDIPNHITCRPVLRKSEIDRYLQELAEERKAREASQTLETAAVPTLTLSDDLPDDITIEELSEMFAAEAANVQIVGDIVVGGHSIVPEDLELEKSAIVGGGKTTYIDTVASSEGKKLTKADLQRLGIRDSQTLDKLVGEMRELAQGRPWKLDLIDTPRGREYRGYIDDKKDDKPKGKAGEGDAGGEGSGEGSQEEYFFKEEL